MEQHLWQCLRELTELPKTLALASRKMRSLEEPVHPQDAVLDELCCSRTVSLEQEKSVKQLRVLALLQDVKEQEDVLPEVGPPLDHHEQRVHRA